LICRYASDQSALDLPPPFGHPDVDPKLLNFGRNETSAGGADKSGDKTAIPRRGLDITGGKTSWNVVDS
jgi:hypothetical protein